MKKTRQIRTVEESKEEPKATPAPVEMSKNDFFAAVHEVSAPKTTNSKNDKIPTLIPPDEIRAKVDEVVKWKAEEKKAKAEKETREFAIIEWAKDYQDNEAFRNNYQKSYRISGVNDMVTFVTSDKFSAIRPEDVKLLQDILGPKFNEYITQKMTVALKEEVLSNPDLQAELMSLIPRDKFSKFFVAETTFVTVDGFDRKRYSLGKKLFEKVMEFVKQTKPSIK